jgi:hypothetical protein
MIRGMKISNSAELNLTKTGNCPDLNFTAKKKDNTVFYELYRKG